MYVSDVLTCRSMLYNGSDIIRDVEWVIFDEVHYVNDAEVSYKQLVVYTVSWQLRSGLYTRFEHHNVLIGRQHRRYSHY